MNQSAGASFILSAIAACVCIAAILRTRLGNRLLDQPNSRSLHVRPVPRIGGLGILGGLLASTLMTGTSLPWQIWGALVLVVGISLLDDLQSVSAAVRLPVHLAAGALMAWAAMPQAPWAWALVLVSRLRLPYSVLIFLSSLGRCRCTVDPASSSYKRGHHLH
jgi:UDP-N-acetylmuramyl pentapeptide phosphotransferase/UDP-N-acetylglucosamine-1-phosphate transferase